MTEGLLNEPPNTDNKDPLTPLDKENTTLKTLASQYRQFTIRVQEQLATFGGGGAVQLQYLDDIVGVGTNISAYDGMFLKVDTSLAADTGHKFTFANVSTASTIWQSNSIGIDTTSHVGVATTARAEYNFYVGAPVGSSATTVVAYFDGDISVAGTIFKENIQNLDSIGIVTAQNGFRATAGGIEIQAGVSTFAGLTTVTSADALHSKQLRVSGVSTFNNTIVGGATTELVVGGDLRVTGILTVGTDSVTIDGTNNKVNVGTAITLDASANKILTPGLQITGTAQPFYPPVMTTTQRDALTVTEGAMIYNSTAAKVQFYNGSSWIDATGVSLGLGMGVF